MMLSKNHIALIPDPDINTLRVSGDYHFHFACSGVNKIRYWFEYTALLDPVWVGEKIIIPKTAIIMDDNKMWNDYVLVATGELGNFQKGEGRVIKGKWKGKMIKFIGGITLQVGQAYKYVKEKDILWIE